MNLEALSCRVEARALARPCQYHSPLTMPGWFNIKWELLRLNTASMCLHDVIPHSCHSVFVYCKWSNTGGGNSLGMRLQSYYACVYESGGLLKAGFIPTSIPTYPQCWAVQVVQSGGEAWKSTFTQVAPLAPLTSCGHTYCKRKEANQWLQQTVGVFQTSDPLYIHLNSIPLTQTNLSTHGRKTETQSLYHAYIYNHYQW